MRSTNISLLIVLTSSLVIYSAKSLADHGSLGFGLGTASPILTQSGITLPANMWAGGMATQFIEFNSASDQKLIEQQAIHGDIHSTNTYLQQSIFGAYGVTDDLTLGVRVPYIFRSGIRTPTSDGDVPKLGSPNGFGDVSFFGQYRFFHTDDQLNHASLIFALKTPTGATSKVDKQGNVFETHFQPGNGSWSPSIGLAFTRAMGQFSFDTNILYTVSTTGTQKVDTGDTFAYNFAVSYAIGGLAKTGLYSSSNNAPWTAVLELNGEWQDYQRVAGVRDPNEGGNVVYISPGIRYSGGKNWNTSLSVGAPIVTNLNGFQTEPDYRITYRLVATF